MSMMVITCEVWIQSVDNNTAHCFLVQGEIVEDDTRFACQRKKCKLFEIMMCCVLPKKDIIGIFLNPCVQLLRLTFNPASHYQIISLSEIRKKS